MTPVCLFSDCPKKLVGVSVQRAIRARQPIAAPGRANVESDCIFESFG